MSSLCRGVRRAISEWTSMGGMKRGRKNSTHSHTLSSSSPRLLPLVTSFRLLPDFPPSISSHALIRHFISRLTTGLLLNRNSPQHHVSLLGMNNMDKCRYDGSGEGITRKSTSETAELNVYREIGSDIHFVLK